MPKSKSSRSESEGNGRPGGGGPKNQQKLSSYEMQRLKTIEANKKRMEDLGLHKMANSFMGSVRKTQKSNYEKKGKKKIDEDEDEEYNPTEDDAGLSSSAEEDEDDEEFSLSQKKVRKSLTPKKRAPSQKPVLGSDFADDDDALMQAIALSLQDHVPSKTPATMDVAIGKRKDNSYIQNDSGKKKKRKKPISSRVQMTEDEMIAHFFQFDEIGKGGISIRDIQRLATAHDFTWSEKEITDMVSCFDGDGDGKINLDDFRKIVCRCNMLKG